MSLHKYQTFKRPYIYRYVMDINSAVFADPINGCSSTPERSIPL